MLSESLDKTDDPMEAAEKADKFAEIFCRNMGFSMEAPAEGVDRYIGVIDKIVCYCDQHPKAVDMLTGVATFVVGAFVGKKADDEIDEIKKENIDFDKLD
jgi:hypothetical protein